MKQKEIVRDLFCDTDSKMDPLHDVEPEIIASNGAPDGPGVWQEEPDSSVVADVDVWDQGEPEVDHGPVFLFDRCAHHINMEIDDINVQKEEAPETGSQDADLRPNHGAIHKIVFVIAAVWCSTISYTGATLVLMYASSLDE